MKRLLIGDVCPCHRGSLLRFVHDIDRARRRFMCVPFDWTAEKALSGQHSWHWFDEAEYILGKVAWEKAHPETNELGEITP